MKSVSESEVLRKAVADGRSSSSRGNVADALLARAMEAVGLPSEGSRKTL